MSGNRKSRIQQTRLSIESLEARSLLSGIHAVAAVHAAEHQPAIVSSSSTKASTAAVKAIETHSETHLTASLADASGATKVTGTAQYESETNNGVVKSELQVQVKGATPNAVIDVKVADATVGQITVKADGTGQLKLSAKAPVLAEKAVISFSTTDATGVTTVLASGTFAAPATKPTGPHDPSGEQSESHLAASITDPASKLTATASYESETEHGLVVSEFNVRIKGATPAAEIDVALVDAKGVSTSVGRITIAADGTGRLTLKAASPAVNAGDVLVLSAVNADGTLTKIADSAFVVPVKKK